MRNAVLNAVSNALRKKGKRFIELWKKAPQKADMEIVKNDIDVIKRNAQKEGNDWILKIRKGAK